MANSNKFSEIFRRMSIFSHISKSVVEGIYLARISLYKMIGDEYRYRLSILLFNIIRNLNKIDAILDDLSIEIISMSEKSIKNKDYKSLKKYNRMLKLINRSQELIFETLKTLKVVELMAVLNKYKVKK